MILISPFSKKLRDGRPSPKDYPVEIWADLVALLKERYKLPIIQIGTTDEQKVEGVEIFLHNLPFSTIAELLNNCTLWVSVDNFLQHMAHYYNKPGVVLYSYSNPDLFGYPENVNLCYSSLYQKPNQFESWDYPLPPIENYLSAKRILPLIEEEFVL